ncbi:hypothetical protein ACIO8G_37550, partial [Streptomyces sp. NPDC087219]|uniref:hypothetical protein n=1 Tax=Streptomyces sp. NPDC087219 TaxID=3365770 RepID=UPI0038016249
MWNAGKTSEYAKCNSSAPSEDDPDFAFSKESAAAGDLVRTIAATYLEGDRYRDFMRTYQSELDKFMR